MKKFQGFTIIEMLIVVTIIAVLSGLILRGMGGALPKTRDSRRLGDLKNIQNMLELYYTKTGSYPSAFEGGSFLTEFELEVALQAQLGSNVKVPRDPSGGPNHYYYCPGAASATGSITSYILGAVMETGVPSDSITGQTCASKTCGSGNFYCVGM
ncbi:MAG: prepilin-type N-terminal cleavage/methylation domain-containing protein [Minisyncoccia bacterium]